MEEGPHLNSLLISRQSPINKLISVLLYKASIMKFLAFIVAMFCFTLMGGAQDIKIELNKTTDKYGLSLKKEVPFPFIKSPNKMSLDRKKLGFDERPDSIIVPRPLYPWALSNMPSVIPDTGNIARIPNALPYLEIPEVAAIPNPLLRKKSTLNPSPLN
jgi:hypothetical protein